MHHGIIGLLFIATGSTAMVETKPPVFQDPHFMTFARAVAGNDIDTVKTLLNEGADVKTQGKGGYTVTHFALTAPNTGIIKLLLNAGADPISVLESGNTVPHDTASRGDGTSDHLAILLDHGVVLR